MEERILKCVKNKEFIGEDILLELQDYLVNNTCYSLEEISSILITINNYNHRLRNQLMKENTKMKELLNSRSKEVLKVETIKPVEDIKIIDNEQEDLSLNLDINFYLELLKNVYDYEDIVDILPDKQTDNYLDIINSILIYYYGELITIKEVLKEEYDEELVKEKEKYEHKISLIKRYSKDLNNSQTKLPQKETKLIFLKTVGDNVCILSDIERDIEPEFYSDIKDLLVGLKHGNFKNVKPFTDNRALSGLSEVKYHQARITFKRLSHNTYIVMHAFIKKWANDLHYRNFLKDRYALYKNQSNNIEQSITADKYIQENNDIYHQIIKTLNKEKRGEGNAKIKK